MKRLLIYFSTLVFFAGSLNAIPNIKVVKLVPNTPEQIMNKPQVPVLCFHHISVGPKSEYRVSPEIFEKDMQILADSGYHSILPSQLYNYLVYNKPLQKKPVMITFDDSREEQATVAAPILEKYGFRGVFFIMTITYNKKNYMTENQIAALEKAGHIVGLHSWDHIMTTKYLNNSDWEKEVIKPKAKLEKIIGMPVDYWAYPDGVWNHASAEGLNKYFNISFILSGKRDSTLPLQTVRRMIVPDWPALTMLKAMERTFRTKN